VDTWVLSVVGFLATTTSLVRLLPQAVRTYRQRRDPPALAGVSLPTQWLTFANSCLWLTFGVLLTMSSQAGPSALWVAAPSAVNAPVALAVIYWVTRGRRLEVPVRQAPTRACCQAPG
jgi:uncharacterized protein with PQ loop repeat